MIDAKTEQRLGELRSRLEISIRDLRDIESEIEWADKVLRTDYKSEHIGVRGWVADARDASDILRSLCDDIDDMTEELSET